MKALPLIHLSMAPLFVLLLSIGSALGSSDYKWYCAIGSQPTVEVVWSEKAQAFVIWDGNHSTGVEVGTPGGQRKLEDNDAEFFSLRSLRGVFSPMNDEINDEMESSLLVSRHTQETNASGIVLEGDEEFMKVVQVRRCPCWSSMAQESIKDFYCPAARTHCGLAAGYGDFSLAESNIQQPGCLDVSQQQTFARNVWPVITIWYLALFICLVLTRPGKHAVGYVLSFFVKGWNVYKTNRILREDPVYVNEIVLRHIAANPAAANLDVSYGSHNSDDGNDDNNRNDTGATDNILMEPAGFEVSFESFPLQSDDGNNRSNKKEFLLHTKKYHCAMHRCNLGKKKRANTHDSTSEDEDKCDASSGSQEDGDKGLEVTIDGNTHFEDGDDGMVDCSICHTEIEEGDRVGDLVCGHIMHIECLKSWIPRRNICPLCRAENIAKPREPPCIGDIDIHDATSPEFHELVVSGE